MRGKKPPPIPSSSVDISIF
nr:unnamed protein product [Callosobruchus chinensis]